MSNRVTDGRALGWPLERSHEALAAIAARILPDANYPLPPVPKPEAMDREVLGRWLDTAVSAWQFEAEPVQPAYAGLSRFLQKSGPALILLPGPDTPCHPARSPGNSAGSHLP